MDVKKLFEISQQNQNNNLEITKEEAEKFKNAFEDPEFCKLMAEYVAELQDPTNRAENESYISQLEGENKVPEGKELIRPIPGFVAKTRKIEKEIESKVFINIVQSEKIAAPTKKETKQGQNWSLPYSLGPPHMEKDKNGESVAAFDCCFHPEALQLSTRSKQFRDLLVSTAISGLEEAYRRQRLQVTVQKEFHVLKGVSYKSGQIPTMLIDISGKNKWNESESTTPTPTPTPSSNSSVQSTASTSENKQISNKTSTTPAIQKGFLNKPSKTKSQTTPSSSTTTTTTTTTPSTPLVQELSGEQQQKYQQQSLKSETEQKKVGPVSPEYSFIERGVVSLGDFETGNGVKVTSTRPAELVYRIDIPLVIKTSEVELDVGERDLKLKYSNVYDLHIQLPYPVFDKKGVAKFDKAKKQLSITLPVQPHAPIKSPIISDNDHIDTSTNEEESLKESTSTTSPTKSDTNSPSTSAASAPTSSKKEKLSSTKAHGRWVENTENEESKKLHDEVKSKAEEAKRLAEENLKNTSSSTSSSQQQQQQQPSTPITKVSTSNKVDKQVENEIRGEFIQSDKFNGEKIGYVFKRGEKGLGYYLDPYQCQPSQITSPVKSTLDTTILSSVEKASTKNVKTFNNFSYEFRQTKEALAIIIQVPGVIESTVDIQFNKQSFDISFQANKETLKENGEIVNHIEEYSQGFNLFNEIQIESCKFDIATQNLVVLLQKSVPEYWIDKSVPRKEIIQAREYIPRQSLLKINQTNNNNNNNEASSLSSLSTSNNNNNNNNNNNSNNTINIPTPSELLEAMKFSTQGLFDLD